QGLDPAASIFILDFFEFLLERFVVRPLLLYLLRHRVALLVELLEIGVHALQQFHKFFGIYHRTASVANEPRGSSQSRSRQPLPWYLCIFSNILLYLAVLIKFHLFALTLSRIWPISPTLCLKISRSIF